MRIFVDDIRETPSGYVRCYTVGETLDLIVDCYKKDIPIEEISLDHDAGDFGQDYIHILYWLEEMLYLAGVDYVKDTKFYLHTGNPVGRDNMWRIIKKCGWKLKEDAEDF